MKRELAGGFELDDDPERIDVDAVHAFLSRDSYWGRDYTRAFVERAIQGSTKVMGLYVQDGAQIGFARAISDGVTVAYLADVYVLGPYRGRNLGLELVREILDGGTGELSRNVRWLLHTADARGLYAKLGFGERVGPYPLLERLSARDKQ